MSGKHDLEDEYEDEIEYDIEDILNEDFSDDYSAEYEPSDEDGDYDEDEDGDYSEGEGYDVDDPADAEAEDEEWMKEPDIRHRNSERPVKGKKQRAARQSALAEVYDWMEAIITALFVCVIVLIFFVRIIGVDGTSMVPTLHDENRIVISNLFYTPKQGDVVVFRKESFKSEPLVKRIIATEGQTVDIDFDTGVVTVDGVALKEDYLDVVTRERMHFKKEVTVPEGYIFVMGDNRNDSTDSRDNRIGFVDVRSIIGRVYFILFPLSDFGFVK